MSDAKVKLVKELKKTIRVMAQMEPVITIKGKEEDDLKIVLPYLQKKAYTLINQLVK